ncbi:MAG: topoisomerase DNA-binding C4 zinc finger domain-containing protein [Gemmatales bacterium]|nr:topoisomerase DNA-binding C4 zinc finger domain-containing protein [Gemmatales bacterium]
MKKDESEAKKEPPRQTEHQCPECGKPLVERRGRRGPFLACSGFPECKVTMKLDAEGKPVPAAVKTEHTCDKCGSPMVIRSGRRGPFLACSSYPKCKYALDLDAQGNPVKPIETGVTCDKCGGPMVVRKGPRGPFLGCAAYPKCRSIKNIKDLPEELQEEIRRRYPPPVKKEVPQVEITETCPECGSPMKLRRGRQGWFLGCSKYPRCRGTRETGPELQEKLNQTDPMPV